MYGRRRYSAPRGRSRGRRSYSMSERRAYRAGRSAAYRTGAKRTTRRYYTGGSYY